MPGLGGLVVAVIVLCAAPAVAAAAPALYDLAKGGYPLDGIERVLAPTGKVRCPTVAKVRYRGETVRYHSSVTVAKPFVPHLQAFELLVAEVGRRHFGRAPRLLRHIGTYNCRRIRQWPTFLSEHGLANGIDVAGFEFGPLPRDAKRSLPAPLRRRFSTRVKQHWRSERPEHAAFRAFWHDLGRELVAAKHILRVVLGPGYPGHEDHLHLDNAPWRMTELDLDAAPRPANPAKSPGPAE